MRQSGLLTIIVALLAAGCGPAVAVNVVGASDADADGDADSDREGGGGSVYNAPPHRFTPAPVARKNRSVSPPKLNYRDLPALTMRMGECFGRYEEDAKLAGISTGGGGGGSGSGYGGGMVAGSTAPSGAKSKRASSAKPSTPAPPAPAMPSSMPTPVLSADMSAPSMEMAQEAPASSGAPDREEKSESKEDAQIAADDDLPADEYEDWGAAIYLSNDDSMSLSSAQRVMFAIDSFLPLPVEHIRPHELLNYFSFDTAEVEDGHDFSILPAVERDPRQEGVYSLALSVSGRPVTKQTRRNAAVTFVIDRSGSMSDEGRMEYLKRGLRKSVSELKDGDMVHLVLFDHEVCTPVENFVVGRDDMAQLKQAIDALEPMGATDVHLGLSTGYALADRSYQGHHSNRVVLITDALTNTGETDEGMIAMISRYYDTRRIRLSGVGVGRDFNDSLLDSLTEAGKGAYVFLGSEAEVDAVFGGRFISLIETVAMDVHFRLHLPASLRMNVFYGEESSVYKEDVQAIHYFANTSQLFLSDLVARGGAIRPQDDIMVTIEYEDPETADELVEEYAFRLGEVMEIDPYNVRKARLVMTFIDMLAVMAARDYPQSYGYSAGSWVDEEAYYLCEEGKGELAKQAESTGDDPEVRRVLQLWEKYCSRYELVRRPVKRDTLHKRTPGWPGATPETVR